MKKMFAVLLSSLVLVSGAISASAFESPGVANNGNGKVDNNGNGTSQNNNNNNSNSNSPKTGATSTFAVLMAGAALAFGGVAASAKKKISE